LPYLEANYATTTTSFANWKESSVERVVRHVMSRM